MPVLDVGEGAHAVLARPGRGRVVASYRRAAYLRLHGEVVALVDTSVASGPLHIRCAALPRLREGLAVSSDGVRLTGSDWALRVDGPVRRGDVPDPDALAGGSREPGVGDELTALATGVATAPRLGDLLRAGRVEDVAAAVGGRGPGLTPAGDDLLAGVLVVARLWWGADAGSRLDAIAAGVPTTDVARGFLRWAARGQCIDPVHDWLAAVARGRAEDTERAGRRVVAVGATSGAHLAAGLALGVTRLPQTGQLPRTASQIARAGPDPTLRQRAGRSPG